MNKKKQETLTMSFLSTLVPTIFRRISSSCWITMSLKIREETILRYKTLTQQQYHGRSGKATLHTERMMLYFMFQCGFLRFPRFNWITLNFKNCQSLSKEMIW